MKSSEAHQLRDILQVILGAIDIGNLELARQAVYRAESCIVNCRLACDSCEMLNAPPENWPKGNVTSIKRH